MSTGFVGPRREKVCTSNYCHVTKTETFSEEENQNTEILSVSNCGDIPGKFTETVPVEEFNYRI